MAGLGFGLDINRGGGGGAADPISILGDKLAAWYASGPVVSVPAPSCTITLTGDIAAEFGRQPMTISGQTASAVQIDPAANYAASTDYTTMTPPPASGIAITEIDLARDGAMLAQAIIGDLFTGNYISVSSTSSNYSMAQFVGSVSSGELYNSPAPANFALGYGSDGTLYAYVDGVQVSTSAMDAILPSGAYLVASAYDGSAGDSASVTFRTAAADFTQTYPAGTLDWCGNPIGTSYVEGLFTTSTGETPVTAAGEPVGLRFDKSKGMVLTGNLIAIPEPTVSQLSAKGGALSDYTSVGDSLHEQWVEFENNTISSYAYMQSGDVPNVGTLTIDVWMLDSDTPPIIGASAPANMGLAYKTASVPAPMVGIEKLEPFRYRLHCGPVFVGTSTGFGAVCYSANTFRPFRVSGYDVRRVEGNHAIQTTPTARPLYQVTPQRIVYDGVDDALVTTFAAAVGADCTVARAIPGTGASITTGVNIGTSFTDGVTAQELVIANAALTAGETAALTAYLNRVAGV